MEEVKEWNNHSRYMWVWNGEDYATNRRKAFVVCVHTQPTCLPVVTIDQSTGWVDYYEHCAEIDGSEVDLAEEERLDRTLAEELDRAEQTCKQDYARAELSLERVTRIIQRKYPTLEAIMTGSGLAYVDAGNPHDEYYSLEDIRERYKD